MTIKKFPPIMGIDTASEDAALERGGDHAALFVRDAVNVTFTETGRTKLRSGVALRSAIPYKNLWQSSLHGDCFATLERDWVRVNTSDWSHEILQSDVVQGEVSHLVLNNHVLMCCATGLYIFDGRSAGALTIQTPAQPHVFAGGDGSLIKGRYGFAISWLFNNVESALSEVAHVEITNTSGVSIQFPMCLDERVTHVRLYATELNGGELRVLSDYPVSELSTTITLIDSLGKGAQFKNLSPMLSGNFCRLWRGRLMVARSNVLHFSEPMTFHLTDERYNFVQFPQRITFVEAVESGIWVGQVDHVAFLRGADLKSFVLEKKASGRPVPFSSTVLKSADLNLDISQGMETALWLSDNGYVLGTSVGQLMEVQSDHLDNIAAGRGHTVGFDNKVFTIVS